MKLEYRDLSSSRPEGLQRPRRYTLGFLDYFAASLLIFAASIYLVLPRQIDRVVDVVFYEASSNSYTSYRCIQDKTTKHLFTQSRDVRELRASVTMVRYAELNRLGHPQPDPACQAARGFTEPVTRFEYFFGWLTKAVS
jgi:hypothetical protein